MNNLNITERSPSLVLVEQLQQRHVTGCIFNNLAALRVYPEFCSVPLSVGSTRAMVKPFALSRIRKRLQQMVAV